MTIGSELELARLEYRERQIRRVLQRLRERARAAGTGSTERAGIQRAIGEFALELREVRTRIDARRGRTPAAVVAIGDEATA